MAHTVIRCAIFYLILNAEFMDNAIQIQTIMGIPSETYKQLDDEYKRINPLSLPDVRPRRRRIVRRELVYVSNRPV